MTSEQRAEMIGRLMDAKPGIAWTRDEIAVVLDCTCEEVDVALNEAYEEGWIRPAFPHPNHPHNVGWTHA